MIVLLLRNENHDCREVERYDPFINKWSFVAPLNCARNRLGVGTIDNCIYAAGGSCGQQLLASVERFCPSREQEGWMDVAPMNTPRLGLAMCTHSRLLYAIGGFDGKRRLKDVESYNPDTNTWRREKPLNIGRSGAAAASLQQWIFVVGGFASDNEERSLQLNEVERYDTTTEQWVFVTPLKFRRSALSCVTLDNQLFAMGKKKVEAIF
jgi:N-acetylneuraminic acid mutarotase